MQVTRRSPCMPVVSHQKRGRPFFLIRRSSSIEELTSIDDGSRLQKFRPSSACLLIVPGLHAFTHMSSPHMRARTFDRYAPIASPIGDSAIRAFLLIAGVYPTDVALFIWGARHQTYYVGAL